MGEVGAPNRAFWDNMECWKVGKFKLSSVADKGNDSGVLVVAEILARKGGYSNF